MSQATKFNVTLKGLDYETMHRFRMFIKQLDLKPKQIEVKEQ